MDLRDAHGCGQMCPVGRDEGELISLGDKDGVDVTLKASESICAKVLDRVRDAMCSWLDIDTHIDRTNKVLVASEEVRESKAEDDCEDPGTEKTLNSLLGTDFDELGTAKCDAANISKDIVRDDQGSGQEEPNHALEDVVHDEMGLDDNQIKSHVGPCELGELEFVVALFQGHDEEDET